MSGLLVTPPNIVRMVGLWLDLRRNPTKCENNRLILTEFFRTCSWDEENAFYILLHEDYIK